MIKDSNALHYGVTENPNCAQVITIPMSSVIFTETDKEFVYSTKIQKSIW